MKFIETPNGVFIMKTQNEIRAAYDRDMTPIHAAFIRDLEVINAAYERDLEVISAAFVRDRAPIHAAFNRDRATSFATAYLIGSETNDLMDVVVTGLTEQVK
jgi:hypothetical protein